MFLTEVVLIGALGSIIGIGLGYVFGNVAGSFMGNLGTGSSGILSKLSSDGAISASLSWNLILTALAFGLGTTIIFGFLPAYRASQKPPVETLRAE